MHDLLLHHKNPEADPPPSLSRQLLRFALVVAVLGVLPYVLDAPRAWQLLGTLVSVLLVARGLQLIWRVCFSTDPRHLARD